MTWESVKYGDLCTSSKIVTAPMQRCSYKYMYTYTHVDSQCWCGTFGCIRRAGYGTGTGPRGASDGHTRHRHKTAQPENETGANSGRCIVEVPSIVTDTRALHKGRAHIPNPRRACAARVMVLGLCVCEHVTTFSATACYNAHNKTYHRLQWDMRKVLCLVFSLKMLRSGIMAIFQL